jgi:hypothetical protein
MIVEAEVVKQLSRRRLNAHHRYPSRIRRGRESRRDSDHNQSLTFSTVSANSGRSQTAGERAESTRKSPPEIPPGG